MQSFLGITPAAGPIGASSASDAPTSDARSASDRANGDAFRTALSAANRRSGGSGNTERSSSRPTTATSQEATSNEGHAVSSVDESTTDAAMADDALAMLLSWLVPVTPTATVPVATAPTGTGDASATTAAIGTAADGALVASFGTLTALPTGPVTDPIAQGALLEASIGPGDIIGTTGSVIGTTDEMTSPASASTAGQADPTLTSGIPLTGMTPTPNGDPEALDPALLAAMRATAEARAATGASASAQAAGSAATTDMAGLAAELGAQIVASTASTGQADDTQLSPSGSTAQAAGAGTATGVQLPGQAVAAAGASSQGTGNTLTEALEAGPENVSGGQSGPEAPTEFQTVLGATSTNGVGQAQDVDTVQASTMSAPPIASQIADGALMAARRIGQSVEMILQPEGLGSISLRVTAERAGLAVHMAVENPQAREMVQASWPQLQQALEQRGLTVQSLLLDLSNGRGGGEGFQAFQQFSGQQQFTGQQARGAAANPDRRGGLAVTSVDEGTHTRSDAGAASRVDYRI